MAFREARSRAIKARALIRPRLGTGTRPASDYRPSDVCSDDHTSGSPRPGDPKRRTMRKTLQEIEKHELFQELFPINEEIKERIKRDMAENGFDENQPVVLAKWPDQEEPVCIDGYTRLRVAEELDIVEIPTVTYSVATEQDAFELALKRQANRRSLTDAEIFQCVETIITRYGNPPNGGPKYEVQEIADKLGISKRKAERTLRVAEMATAETKKQIKTGATTIHKAETTVKSSSTEPRPSSEKPRKRRGESRMVAIDLDQWERLTELAENTGADIEELVYEAVQLYLEEDDEEDDTESEEAHDRAEFEEMWESADEEENAESDVDAA
jgi:hypothetical protein